MLKVKAWVYGKLTGYAPLTTALGSPSKIVEGYPDVFTIMPLVCYQEISQDQNANYDNAGKSYESTVQVDVWTALNSSTTDIASIVADLLEGLLFNLDMAGDIPEPGAKLRHKVMRFRRSLVADDLV